MHHVIGARATLARLADTLADRYRLVRLLLIRRPAADAPRLSGIATNVAQVGRRTLAAQGGTTP